MMYTMRNLVVLLLILFELKRDVAFRGGSPPVLFRGLPSSTSSSLSVPRSATTRLALSFNPFLNNKNTNVNWFSPELAPFFSFVETQELLSPEQELLFGKAVKLQAQVEQIRGTLTEKLDLMQDKAALDSADEELAKTLGVSVATLKKMERYADYAKGRLVNSNLKLVLAIVSRYRTAGIPNAELIAEGTRGLSKAALRYDYTKGFRFATYATWYVHQAVAEYVRWRRNPAKMPSRYVVLSRRMKQFMKEFEASEGKGRKPTVDEMASGALHVLLSPSRPLMSVAQFSSRVYPLRPLPALGQSRYDVMKVQHMGQYPVLLNTAMRGSAKSDGSRDRTYEDIVPSVFKAPLAHTDSREVRRGMEAMMLNTLNDVERDVLRSRLGLDDGRVKAVKEVGKRFQISWKQVRKTEKEALSKLRVSDGVEEFRQNFDITDASAPIA